MSIFKFNPFTGNFDRVNPDSGGGVIPTDPSDKLDVYDTVGGQVLNASYQTVVFDQTRTITNTVFGYAPLSGEVTFLSDGEFLVVTRVSTETTTGTTRSQTAMKVQVNTGGGYADVPGTMGYMYNREVTEGKATGVASFVYTATAGDTLRVQAVRISGNNVATIADGSSLSILSYSGPKGDQGPPGSIGAAGNVGDLQFNDGLGNLDATSNLNYASGSNELNIGSQVNVTPGNDLFVDDGIVCASRVTAPAGFIFINTPGKAGSLVAGGANATFRFDNSGGFAIQSQPRANIENKDNSGLTTHVLMNTGGITFNNNNGNFDFIIKKDNGTEAYRYDAGLDFHRFSGDFRVDDLTPTIGYANQGSANTDNVDLQVINSAGNAEVAFRVNNAGNNVAFGGFSGGLIDQLNFNLNQGVNELVMDTFNTTFNSGFQDRNFRIRKQGSGDVLNYDAGTDQLDINSTTNIDATVSFMKPVYNEAISALVLVRADGDNAVAIADNDTYENASVVGVAFDTGGPAFNGRVVSHGRIQDGSFTFGTNVTLYLGASGVITSTPPATGVLTRIGKSLGNGSIFINIDDPIEL